MLTEVVRAKERYRCYRCRRDIELGEEYVKDVWGIFCLECAPEERMSRLIGVVPVETKRYYAGFPPLSGAGPGLVMVVVLSEYGTVEYPLPCFLNEVNHGPTGFAWGYGGSGPAQLAYAILRDYGLPREVAFRLYQDFKWDVIAKLPQDEPFVVTGDAIEERLRERRWRRTDEVQAVHN